MKIDLDLELHIRPRIKNLLQNLELAIIIIVLQDLQIQKVREITEALVPIIGVSAHQVVEVQVHTADHQHRQGVVLHIVLLHLQGVLQEVCPGDHLQADLHLEEKGDNTLQRESKLDSLFI